jgi:pseudouridine kinase
VHTEPYAVVVGGAAVDVKARSLAPARLHTSNPGTVTRTLGGVGRNVAEGIARLGGRVHLVAAVGADPDGEDLLARTGQAGVGLAHVVRSAHPTGTYLALLDSTGELVAAVSDFAATDTLGLAEIAGARDLVAGADVVVVDGNLPAAIVVWLLTVAAAGGARVVLEPVSVTKAGRLAPLLKPGRPVFTVTPSVDELAALAGMPVADSQDAVAAAAVLHRRGVAHVWVSRGARGSLFCAADGHVALLPAEPAEVMDVTGAGDALTAGYVHGLLAGQDPIEAARAGHRVAALTIASPHTVRPDLGEAFARSTTSRGADR